MAVSNTFEGRVLVNPDVISQMDIYTYVKRVFPSFGISQIQETVRQYTNSGFNTVDEQAVAIMGECRFLTLSRTNNKRLKRECSNIYLPCLCNPICISWERIQSKLDPVDCSFFKVVAVCQ